MENMQRIKNFSYSLHTYSSPVCSNLELIKQNTTITQTTQSFKLCLRRRKRLKKWVNQNVFISRVFFYSLTEGLTGLVY